MEATATDQQRMSEISEEERELRINLAAAYRLADKYGMSELINTHISLRVPGPTPTYLLNPLGMLFHQITASSLVKLDFAGKLVGPSEWPVNRAGVAIHGSILAARPDINCVFHTHMPYTTAVSALQCGLLPMSQAALRFQGLVREFLRRRKGMHRRLVQPDLGSVREHARQCRYDLSCRAGSVRRGRVVQRQQLRLPA